jgi:DnaJ-class molecular chaperone
VELPTPLGERKLSVAAISGPIEKGRLLIPNRFLCPKCHGQRMTCCSNCGGNGKRSIAGITIGNCKECNGAGQCRCDVCGGTGEIEAVQPPHSELGSDFQYKIKSTAEPHERVAKESQLDRVDGTL